ncbi:MAG: dihydropteroate synthase [Roseivirga sp.]
MKAKDKIFKIKNTLNLRGSLVSLETPAVMGILNVTPDSFYSLSRKTQSGTILTAAEKMLKDGALIIDIGGYSSRPGADHISSQEELKRVILAIELIIKEFPSTNISVDTFRSEVARTAIEAGACMINDISGGELDPLMFDTIVDLKVPYIMMHMKGTPQNMVKNSNYDHLIKEVLLFFARKVDELRLRGVSDIILDPGFGFSKTPDQSYEILRNLNYFKALRLPLLAGLSRKSMIYKTLGITAHEALNGTTALNMIALMNGASLLRVHDVKEAKETIELYKSTYS